MGYTIAADLPAPSAIWALAPRANARTTVKTRVSIRAVEAALSRGNVAVAIFAAGERALVFALPVGDDINLSQDLSRMSHVLRASPTAVVRVEFSPRSLATAQGLLSLVERVPCNPASRARGGLSAGSSRAIARARRSLAEVTVLAKGAARECDARGGLPRFKNNDEFFNSNFRFQDDRSNDKLRSSRRRFHRHDGSIFSIKRPV